VGHRYTDVDQLILKRWDEVRDLRAAFDDLLERMTETVQGALDKVKVAANERDFAADYNLKRPSIWFWKPGWASRRGDHGICLEVYDFVPSEYGRDTEDHPSVWLMTDEFSRLRVRESAEDFGKCLRAALSPELLTKWSHQDVDLGAYPLGREYSEISEADRVSMVAHPDELTRFVLGCLDEATVLVPAIDQALGRMTRR
jgi:hypothetical protein